MKMSSYFRQKHANQASQQRNYATTAQTLLNRQQHLNSDLNPSRAVVKLRLQPRASQSRQDVIQGTKPPKGPRGRYYSCKATVRKDKAWQTQDGTISKNASVKEIELVDAEPIYHDNEQGLKYEMIDTTKAMKIATALKQLKKTILSDTEQAAPRAASEDSFVGDGISFLDKGKISVNLSAFNKTIESKKVDISQKISQKSSASKIGASDVSRLTEKEI